MEKLRVKRGRRLKLYFENLTFLVSPARRASNVGRNPAATFWAFLELGFFPAIGSAAHALLRLGGSAFWYGHGV